VPDEQQSEGQESQAQIPEEARLGPPVGGEFLIHRFVMGSWPTLVLMVISHNAHGISNYRIKSKASGRVADDTANVDIEQALHTFGTVHLSSINPRISAVPVEDKAAVEAVLLHAVEIGFFSAHTNRIKRAPPSTKLLPRANEALHPVKQG
jgi:hypothetical protein